MMPIARKPSKASFPRAIQAAVRHAKARLQALQGKAAGTPRQGCKHVETGLQAHRDWAASTPRLGCKHVQWGKEFSAPQKGARCTSQRSTLHQPAQHAASPIAPPCVFPPNAERQADLLPYPFPHNRKRGWRQVVRKWQQAVARPRKKFYLCPYRTLQTEKDR